MQVKNNNEQEIARNFKKEKEKVLIVGQENHGIQQTGQIEVVTC